MNSVKKSIIAVYSQIDNFHEDLRDNQVSLITAAGIITGKAYKSYGEISDSVDFNNPNSTGNAIARTVIETMNKAALEQSLPEEKRSPLDGFILLEDVKIISFNGSTSFFEFLTVFYDQIIAVTIGNHNSNS